MPKPATATSTSSVEAPAGMVEIPAGPFLFGRKKQEVSLDAFWIDSYPVTNRDYLHYIERHNRPSPHHWPPDGLPDAMLDLPVVLQTLDEVEAYTLAVGKLLPTPAQFEKAARGSDGRKYPWGDSVKARITNTRESGMARLSSVKAFEKGVSPYGCYDMAGNVLHWTRGVYDESKGSRILKGSSFRHYLGGCHWNYEGHPENRQDCVGFRCVWTPAPSAPKT